MTSFRVITFNTAVGNPEIKTEQVAFLELPFYREILEGADAAPILALQEVGPAQAKALKRAAAGGPFSLLHVSRPGQGNALLVPRRFELLHGRSSYFVASQAHAAAGAVRRALRTRKRLDYRQYLELRMWTQARLRDTRSGRRLVVYNTHLSGDGPLRIAQARALFARVHRARRDGPVLLAGDLNVHAGATNPADAAVQAMFEPLRDMAATATDPHRKAIDWILAAGLDPLSCRLYTGGALSLPDQRSAELVSDHYAKEATVTFSDLNEEI